MAEDNGSIQVLLECSNINNTVPYFIEEEIVCSLPDDIEVIQVNNLPELNFDKPLSPNKLPSPKKQPLPKAKRKHTTVQRAKARANKIHPLITLPEPAKDSFIDFCGLKVPVKTLLQNPDIRKQLAPFIEEVIISDISDVSDVEEVGKIQKKKVSVAKERKRPTKPSKKRKKLSEPTVQEGTGPFVEVLIPEAPDSTELIEEDIIVNLPLAIEKDAIKDTQEMYVLEEQIQLVTDSSDDEPIVEQNNGIQKKQTLSKDVNEINRSKISKPVRKKHKNNAKNISDSEVVVLDDILEENDKDKDDNLNINNIQETPVMESDDWYYLNMANTSKIDDNSTVTTVLKANDLTMETPSEKDDKNKNSPAMENDIETDKVLSNQESEVEKAKPRRRKKRRRVPWSRHAIRGTRVSKNVKAKLQGKIVKGGVKNVQNETESTATESRVVHKKADNADPSIVKEITNNVPTTSILDKTNINHNSPHKNGLLPDLQRTSFLDLNEDVIKQEPMLKNADETTTELSEVNQLNKEIEENKLHIKLEQEVSWNTNVDYQNSYIQKNLDKQQSADQQEIPRSMSTRQKQSKLTAKRLFFGRRRMLGKCDNCGKKYERLGALRRHQLMCKVSYECAMCNFFTSDKIAFREHLVNHILGSVNTHEEENSTNAPDNKQMANCSTNSEDSTVLEDLNNSEKCLGYMECYRCKICEKTFDDYSSLRKHIILSLQGAQVAQLQKNTERCNRCGTNGFKTKCEFRYHLMTKCEPKKTMMIPYVRLERCKIPEKSKKETQYQAKSYCPKCLTTSTISEKGMKCNKCKSKLSFICEICRNLSITYADLQTHMFCMHNIDLYNSIDKEKVPEQKCLSIEKEYTMKDVIGNIKELKSQRVSLQYERVNTAITNNSNNTLKTDIIVDDSRTPKQDVEINTKSKENNLISSKNKKTMPVPIIKQITGFYKKMKQSEKQVPDIKTVIKDISPIKQVNRNSIEKLVSGLGIPEESNSEKSTDKYLDQYTMHKGENSSMTDEIIHKNKTLNRKIKSSIMGMQKQYFSKGNDAFGEEKFKNTFFKLSKKVKLGPINQIKRFCIKCDKNKNYYEKIKMGLMREICRKCKIQLLYQCRNCHGVCKDYQKMAWHVIYKCKPRLRFFSVSHKSHLRKIFERRYALLEAQQNIFDSIASQS